MNEEFESLLNTNIVCISEDFLKDYFRDIEPEYFKVYVYALWKKEKIEISKASEETGLTENDIERACKFLVKKKIINKDILKDIKNGICVNFKETKKELIKKNIKDDDKFKEIFLDVSSIYPSFGIRV